MPTDSAFAIRLLEKIGAPLVLAIESAPPEGDESAAASMMAKMLGQAVQISIKLSTTLNAEETEEQADSTRLSMAAIATPLLADFYKTHKRAPEDADIARITKSLEAVIGFADKFTPAADGQSRLTTIDNNIAFFDPTQAILTTTQALTPALLAISEFSFGKSDTKLMQEVAAKLEKKAALLAGGEDNKMGQILVLRALATIYGQCHAQEVEKMSGGDNENAQAPSITPVWEAFEKRTMMMQALVGQDVQQGSVDGQSVAPVVAAAVTPVIEPAPPPSAPEETPAPQPEQVPPAQPAATPTPASPPPSAPPASAPAAGGSPMGFFKPGAKTETPAETPVPAAPPEQASPPAPAAPETPPGEAPKDDTANNFDESSAPPANPMGFFKPGTQKKDDE